MSLMTDYNPRFVKKVHCKDCKYVWWDDISLDMCKEPTIEEEYKNIAYCGDLNCDNECPYYKRKWWKVWVR